MKIQVPIQHLPKFLAACLYEHNFKLERAQFHTRAWFRSHSLEHAHAQWKPCCTTCTFWNKWGAMFSWVSTSFIFEPPNAVDGVHASAMVTSTSTPGSMLMEVICFTISEGECRSMTLLWIRIWKRSHVFEPSPQGVFRVVILRKGKCVWVTDI